MKVLGIAGSPRRNGNTDMLLAEVLRGAADKGAEVKTVVLNNLKFMTCQHCDACLEKGVCRIKDDMQDLYEEFEQKCEDENISVTNRLRELVESECHATEVAADNEAQVQVIHVDVEKVEKVTETDKKKSWFPLDFSPLFGKER